LVELNRYKFFIGKLLFARHFRRVAGQLAGPILDIGAGSAPFRRYLPHPKIVSVDIRPDVRPDVCASVARSPFRDASFESVICTEVLEHVPEPAGALTELRRVIRPNGHLYVTVPMLWPMHYEPHDYYRYTRHGLAYLLDRAGFDVIDIQPVGGLFSFLSMRACEKLFNLVHKLAFFLPKRHRYLWSVPLTLPVSYAMYLLSLVLDPLMPKDVFAWSVLARPSPGTRGATR